MSTAFTPENLREKREALRKQRNELRVFQLRNALNAIFIVLALVAIVLMGYALFREDEQIRMISIGVAVCGILVKMAESALRMTSMLKKPRKMPQKFHNSEK